MWATRLRVVQGGGGKRLRLSPLRASPQARRHRWQHANGDRRSRDVRPEGDDASATVALARISASGRARLAGIFEGSVGGAPTITKRKPPENFMLRIYDHCPKQDL